MQSSKISFLHITTGSPIEIKVSTYADLLSKGLNAHLLGITKESSQSLNSSSSAALWAACVVYVDFFFFSCRHLVLSLLNFIIFLLSYSSSLCGSLWMTPVLFSNLPGPTHVVSTTDLMTVYSHCFLVFDKDVKQDRSQYRSPWYLGCYCPLGR